MLFYLKHQAFFFLFIDFYQHLLARNAQNGATLKFVSAVNSFEVFFSFLDKQKNESFFFQSLGGQIAPLRGYFFC